VLSTDAGETAVVFLPAAPPPVVALVRFTGNEVVPTSALVNAISGVAVGVPYKEARFRQFLDTNLRPLYEARGRLRVAFREITTEAAKDVQGLVVTVRVEEGPSYNLGKVRAESPVMGPEELERIADLRSGDVANFELVQAALARVERSHRREGYMKAAARVERALDDPHRSVDLVIRVEPGPQYVMGTLAIEGLDIHGEDAVRKLWALKEGQRFNADYPDYFLEQMREQGVFDNLGKTKAVLAQDDEARRVDVKLIFAGQEKPKKLRQPE
jgi:outer membrane protein assembly factor BamA